MPLLKNGQEITVRILGRPEVTVRDGWYFGIGFGLALIIAVPVILIIGAVLIALVFALFGGF